MQKLFLLSTTSFVLRTFLRLGMPGLFLMSALDSSFLVLPFGNDLLLMALVSSNRDSLIWIAYVLISAAGSVLGVFVIDLLMRKAGEKGLERFVKPKKLERLKQKLEKQARHHRLCRYTVAASVSLHTSDHDCVGVAMFAQEADRRRLRGPNNSLHDGGDPGVVFWSPGDCLFQLRRGLVRGLRAGCCWDSPEYFVVDSLVQTVIKIP